MLYAPLRALRTQMRQASASLGIRTSVVEIEVAAYTHEETGQARLLRPRSGGTMRPVPSGNHCPPGWTEGQAAKKLSFIFNSWCSCFADRGWLLSAFGEYEAGWYFCLV